MSTKYQVVVYWSEADGCYLAEVPELPRLIADGPTRVDAPQSAEEMIEAYVNTARQAGWPVPEPSGRFAFA